MNDKITSAVIAIVAALAVSLHVELKFPHARPTCPDPPQDADRAIYRRRSAGRFPHAVALFGTRAQPGHHPQRDVGSGGPRAGREPPYVRASDSHPTPPPTLPRHPP